jgi:hypothetical protein
LSGLETTHLDRAKSLATKHQPGHTDFQIRHAIVERSGGTDYGQYRQCLAEIAARIDMAKKDDPTANRELKTLVEIAEELEARLGELTPDRCRQLELATWKYRARKRLAVDLMVHGRPSEGTMDFILWLPEEIRLPLLDTVVSVTTEKRAELANWLYRGAPLLEA